MSHDVVILDYGSGNVRSMFNAVKHALRDDQQVLLSGDPSAIDQAERLIIPGVGAFGEVERKLRASGTLPTVEKLRRSGRPILGVCVGMQVMADEGHEFGTRPGLGWLSGSVRQLVVGATEKLPHFGWSQVAPTPTAALFDGLAGAPHFYFVHSYAMSCETSDDVAAWATYGGRFVAAVQRGNIAGTQFHPEKSDAAGVRFLANFCRWSPS